MLAIRLPVDSRRAPTISSLRKQKPVSSAAVTVPAKARLKSETFMITRLPVSLALNEGGPGSDIIGNRSLTSLPRPGGSNNTASASCVTRVIGGGLG